MKLPNCERAQVPTAKLTNYLLSASHPRGRHKATFFARFGFTPTSWQLLYEALLAHAQEHEVSEIEDSPYGRRYNIDGRLHTPDGRDPRVRVVWFVEEGSEVPRLATVLPLGRAR